MTPRAEHHDSEPPTCPDCEARDRRRSRSFSLAPGGSHKLNTSASIMFASLIFGGVLALVFKLDIIGGTLIAAALGQLGPSPFKATS